MTRLAFVEPIIQAAVEAAGSRGKNAWRSATGSLDLSEISAFDELTKPSRSTIESAMACRKHLATMKWVIRPGGG
jgi:hypothetical protein